MRLRAPFALAALVLGLGAVPAAGESARERDRWQRPAEVMNVLGVTSGSTVADVGAGDGYFTVHLARRVGGAGHVYAVDVLESELQGIRRTSREMGLPQIETVQGKPDDPQLPEASLDAALIVNSYHEMDQGAAMLSGLWRALRPGGRLGIIDKVVEPSESPDAYRARHAIPAEVVRQDAERQGFRFVREAQGFTRPRRGGEAWFYLLFVKELARPAAPIPSSRTSATPS